MSGSVLLAKLGQSILTDENLRKKAVTIVLTIATALCIPFLAIVCIFAGTGQVSADDVQSHVSDSVIEDFEHMEKTAADIAQAFLDNNLADSELAQAAYCMYLFDVQKTDPNFISKLVSCYAAGGTDSEIAVSLQSTFQVNVPADEYTKLATRIRSVSIDASTFSNPEVKNNLDLVAYAKQAASKGWGYVYGTYGLVLTDKLLSQKEQQFPDNILPYKAFIEENWLGTRTADCVGLIKGYAWYDPTTNSFTIGANGMPDVSADGMYTAAATKGAMDTMPDVPGIAVWQSGHIGIYIGDGKVVEAKGTMYGVVTTELSESSWQGWCYLPAIQYNE